MKKFICVWMFCITACAFATDEIPLGTARVKRYNDILKRQIEQSMAVHYLPDDKQFILIFDEVMGESHIWLTGEDRDIFLEAIAKYKKWRLKAIKEGVKLEKEITNFYPDKESFEIGHEFQSARRGQALSIGFFSQNKAKHQLILEIGKLTSSTNEYITMDVDTKYFDFDMVQELEQLLLEKNLAVKVMKFYRKKKVEDEFR